MEAYKDPEKLTEAMKGALARMYADSDIRDYLMHTMNIYNHNVLVALRGNQPDLAKEYTSKFDTMKKLLDNSRIMFSQAEKLKKAPLEELVKENENKSNEESN